MSLLPNPKEQIFSSPEKQDPGSAHMKLKFDSSKFSEINPSSTTVNGSTIGGLPMLTSEQSKQQQDMQNIQMEIVDYDLKWWRRCRMIFWSELVGSMIFGFLVFTMVWKTNQEVIIHNLPQYLANFYVALSVGAGGFLSTFIFLRNSGAHFNFLLSLGFLFTRKVQFSDFCLYVLAGFLGFWIAYALLIFTFWSKLDTIVVALAESFNPVYTDLQGYLFEVLLMCIFSVVILCLHINRDSYLENNGEREVKVGNFGSFNMAVAVGVAYFIFYLVGTTLTNSPISWYLRFNPSLAAANKTGGIGNSDVIFVTGWAFAVLLVFIIFGRMAAFYGWIGDEKSYNKMFTPMDSAARNYGWGSRTVGCLQPPQLYPVQTPNGIMYVQIASMPVVPLTSQRSGFFSGI